MADGNGAHNLAPLLAGFAEDSPVFKREVIKDAHDYEHWLGAASRIRNPKEFLQHVASAHPMASLGAQGEVLHRVSAISKQLLNQTGRIEGEYLRRPNVLCALYTTSLAPGATVAFSVQPGIGNSYYRLLGFIAGDQQADVFGFTSLKVGGQEHVQFSQSTPAAPVTSFVPWNMFMLREQSFKANLAPWAGQVFDQSTPVTGIVANGTVAATGDAITLAARLTFLTQTDPCGMRYDQIKNASNRYWGALRTNIGAYAPLLSHV